MPNQLLTDTLNTTGKFFDTSFEMAVEQEILLADYDRSVFKIIKTCVEHTITQKYINGTKLVIEGFFKISVYYQPPQGANLTVISKKQSFQRQFDLSVAIENPYFIKVDGELQYINTRAINSTRIAVSGVYAFSAKAYTTSQMAVVTALKSNTVCTDDEEIGGFSLCGQGIRQFSIEEEISVPRQTDKILNISSRSGNMAVMVYRDKVNIKGDVTAEIIYTMPDSAEIHSLIKNFSYNQVVDISGITENNAAYADFSIVSFTVTQNPDTDKISCILTAQLDVKAFRKEKVYTVLDAFSKTYEYSKEKKTVFYDENIRSVNRMIRFILEDTIGNEYTPLYHFVTASAPVISSDGNKNGLKTKVTVSAIVRNQQNEIECFNKSRDINLDIGMEINPDDEYIISCQSGESSISISEDVLKSKIALEINGFIIRRKEISILSDFSEDNSNISNQQTNALVLYYGNKGEKVFDIALRYKTDAALIMTENNLDSKQLAEDKMLFIPAFDM